MPKEFVFKKQPKFGEEASLCAYFALLHFKNGNITKDEYINSAAKTYTAIGMAPEDAKSMAMGGNDPQTLTNFGLKKLNKEDAQKREVLIVCDTQNGHFFTIRRREGNWWNYDSYNLESPQVIGDDEAAKKICGAYPIYG